MNDAVKPAVSDEMVRPIIGIENRSAQEVFDIMCDRFRRTAALAAQGQPLLSVTPMQWEEDGDRPRARIGDREYLLNIASDGETWSGLTRVYVFGRETAWSHVPNCSCLPLPQAKAACDADYAARILSQVITAPAAGQEPVAAIQPRETAPSGPDAMLPNHVDVHEGAWAWVIGTNGKKAGWIDTHALFAHQLYRHHPTAALTAPAQPETDDIADAVISWLVKHDLLDAGNEYRASDVLAVLDDLAPAQPVGVPSFYRTRDMNDLGRWNEWKLVLPETGERLMQDVSFRNGQRQIEPLYAAPQPPAEGGWVRVPEKPTHAMAYAAACAHYGKKQVDATGIEGISMTVNSIDYNFPRAFRKFWKGALSALPANGGDTHG